MAEGVMGSVAIESGVLGVGDPTLQVAGGLHPDKWLQHIKDGKAAAVATGGDGTFGVIIRETSNSLDVLLEEGEKIASLSAPLLINVPSGVVRAADMADIDVSASPASNLEFKIEPGVYQCMIHMCDNPAKEFLGFVVVLKRSDLPEAKNGKAWEIEQLG